LIDQIKTLLFIYMVLVSIRLMITSFSYYYFQGIMWRVISINRKVLWLSVSMVKNRELRLKIYHQNLSTLLSFSIWLAPEKRYAKCKNWY